MSKNNKYDHHDTLIYMMKLVVFSIVCIVYNWFVIILVLCHCIIRCLAISIICTVDWIYFGNIIFLVFYIHCIWLNQFIFKHDSWLHSLDNTFEAGSKKKYFSKSKKSVKIVQLKHTLFTAINTITMVHLPENLISN